jgi:spore coat polysaccharide biosynthesis protein SpsF
MAKKKVVSIIQARMGSSRFPKKMMSLLNGEPLIDWVIKRSMSASLVDQTILATSNLRQDDILSDRAKYLGCSVFRGDELDVLSRYSQAARLFNAEIVVRICGDRPLVDPILIDSAIKHYLSSEIDLSYNHISGQSQNWPRGFGVEVLSNSLLQDLNMTVIDEYEREHVTLNLWNKKTHLISADFCPPEIDPGFIDLKLDVDTIEDLQRLIAISAGLDINSSALKFVQSWQSCYQ